MSSLAIVAQPFAEPVTLEAMRLHLKADSDVTTDDVLISSQIAAARDVIETATGANCNRQKCMMATTFALKLDYLYGAHIDIPRVPVIAVSSITYLDSAGDSQTLATTVYDVDLAGGRINLAYGQVWPSTYSVPNSVTVNFVAGMAATFGGENTNTDVMTVYGRTLTNGDRVRLLNSGGALPTGLSALTDYFAVGVSGSTFQLSATSGGAAVDLTAVGSGTQYLSNDLTGFETLRAAIKLLVGHWYQNREAVNIGNSVSVLPMAVESLVNSQHA